MRRIRVLLIGSGTVLMAYGMLGLVVDPGVRLPGVVLFAVAVLAGHDALLMPAVHLIARLLHRRGPAGSGRRPLAVEDAGRGRLRGR